MSPLIALPKRLPMHAFRCSRLLKMPPLRSCLASAIAVTNALNSVSVSSGR